MQLDDSRINNEEGDVREELSTDATEGPKDDKKVVVKIASVI